MIIKSTLIENDMTFQADLGEVHNISDDSFQRGYEEGEAAGYETGHGVGYDEGYADGEERWKTYWLNGGDTFEIPEDWTEIPKRMFYGHTGLARVSVPSSVVKVGAEAFSGCTGLLDFPVMEGVTEIGDNAFANCSLLDELNFAPTVTKIGQYAFYLCKLLGAVKLPPKLEAIRSALFAGCPAVKVRAIPDACTRIEAYALDNCQANNTAVIGAGVKTIANAAFRANKGITEITFLGTPQSIASSGDRAAFYNCTNLKKINVPWASGAVAGAPWGAPSSAQIVYNWKNITTSSYTFPTGLQEIPAEICKGNTTIKEVVLGDEVTAIRPDAFNGCTNLGKVQFPEGLVIIEEYAFYGCSKLKITALPDTVDEIESGSMAGGVASLSKLPAAIRKLETYCFDGCPGNTFTEFPESLVVISAYALRNNTGLTTLTFKGTPEYGIAATALVGCTNLTDIYVPWPEGAVNGEFDANGARINWGAPNATVHHQVSELMTP